MSQKLQLYEKAKQRVTDLTADDGSSEHKNDDIDENRGPTERNPTFDLNNMDPSRISVSSKHAFGHGNTNIGAGFYSYSHRWVHTLRDEGL